MLGLVSIQTMTQKQIMIFSGTCVMVNKYFKCLHIWLFRLKMEALRIQSLYELYITLTCWSWHCLQWPPCRLPTREQCLPRSRRHAGGWLPQLLLLLRCKFCVLILLTGGVQPIKVIVHRGSLSTLNWESYQYAIHSID